jgi:hypothetical protein
MPNKLFSRSQRHMLASPKAAVNEKSRLPLLCPGAPLRLKAARPTTRDLREPGNVIQAILSLLGQGAVLVALLRPEAEPELRPEVVLTDLVLPGGAAGSL